MKEQTKINILLNVALFFIVFALIGQAYLLIDKTGGSNAIINVSRGFSIVALLSACIYIGTEFKKSSAKYFKFFLYCYILSRLTFILTNIVIRAEYYILIGSISEFVALNILFGVKDLGKLKSLILSSIALVINIVLCLILSIKFANNLGASAGFSLFLMCFTPIALSAVLLIMMVLKYHDKAMRKQQQEENK